MSQPPPAHEPQVAIVTGASSGIGQAIARGLAARGMVVVAAARRLDDLQRLQAEIESQGGRALSVRTDVAQLPDIEALVRAALSVTGRIDVLVNAAGIGHGHSIMTDDRQVTQLMAVNLVAPIRLMRLIVPIMASQRHGAIINIGSISGEIGYQAIYGATKFGLRGLTDSVRREVLGTGIDVTLIEPGYIATPMTASRSGRMPGPQIVVRAVERALDRPRRRIFVPGRFRVHQMLASAFPGITDRIYAGKSADPQPR
jgi:NAD(P)-dependent dehydrogenase (short-subunit alcohol dehydrogenase family)